MEERTLLVDIETEKKKQVEKAFSKNKASSEFNLKKNKKAINPFSASAFPKNVIISEDEEENEEIIEKNVENEEKSIKEYEKIIENDEKKIESDSSTIIEKPNYDMIDTLSDEQRTKVFEVKNDRRKLFTKPKRNMFKLVMLSILFALFGVWGIVNLAEIDSLNRNIAQVSTEYKVNLVSYLNNLHNLDATNSNNMENLFETISEAGPGAPTLKEQSNWFDRFCNFIGGLFGG